MVMGTVIVLSKIVAVSAIPAVIVEWLVRESSLP